VALYKATVALLRAFANLADRLEPAGYSAARIDEIKEHVKTYLNIRDIVRLASGESLDLKAYEADMRHLIDTYIEAAQPRTISPFENLSLLEIINKTGIAEAIDQQLGGLQGEPEAIAETIENNVRSKIVKEHLSDPAYYEKMSALLDEIIADRKARAIEYEEYLKRIGWLAQHVQTGQADDTPKAVNTPGRRALYNNLNLDADLALRVDAAIHAARPDDWRGVPTKERAIKAALYHELGDHDLVEKVFNIILNQSEY
jgi:type I restriction enzyme R subunit